MLFDVIFIVAIQRLSIEQILPGTDKVEVLIHRVSFSENVQLRFASHFLRFKQLIQRPVINVKRASETSRCSRKTC